MQSSIYHNGSLKSKPPRPSERRIIVVNNQATSDSKSMNPQPVPAYGQAAGAPAPPPITRQVSEASRQIYEMQALGRTQTMARNASTASTNANAKAIPITAPPSQAKSVQQPQAVSRVQTQTPTAAPNTYYAQYYRTPQYQQMTAYPPQYTTQMTIPMQYPQMTTYRPTYSQQMSAYPVTTQMNTAYARMSSAQPQQQRQQQPQRQPQVPYTVPSKVAAPNGYNPNQRVQPQYGQPQHRQPANTAQGQNQGPAHNQAQNRRNPYSQYGQSQNQPQRGPPPTNSGAYGANNSYNPRYGSNNSTSNGNRGYSNNRYPPNNGNGGNRGGYSNQNGNGSRWTKNQNQNTNRWNNPNASNSWNGNPNGNGNRNGNGNVSGGNGQWNGNRNQGAYGNANGNSNNRSQWGPPQRRNQNVNDDNRRPRPNGNYCRYYGSAMGCKWGETCYQDHSNPNSVEFCPQFRSEWGCQWYDECWFRHVEFTDPKDAMNRQKSRRVHLLSAEDFDDGVDDEKSLSVESEPVSVLRDPVTPPPVDKEREITKVYKVSPDRKSMITVDDEEEEEEEERGNTLKNGLTPHHRNDKQKKSAFTKMDDSLAVYYDDLGRSDYYNEDGRGKFIEFAEMNGFDEDQMEEQLGLNVEAMQCLYLDMDGDFPLRKTYKTTEERNEAIFNVLQDCYRLGRKSRSITPRVGGGGGRRKSLTPLRNGVKNGSTPIRSNSTKLRRNAQCTPCTVQSKVNLMTMRLNKLRCHDLEQKEEGCSYLNRMISTLRHYSKIDVSNDDADAAEFLDFMGQNVGNILDDFIHIMEGHPPPDIQLIQRRKSAEFQLFNACDPNNCLMLIPKQKEEKELCPAFGSAGGCKWGDACTKSHDNPNSVKLCDNFLKPEGCPFGKECYFRHQTWSQPEKATPAGGEAFVFYRDLMDSMHCYLIHSHDVEYRIKVRHRMKVEDQRMDEAKWKIWGDDRFRFKKKVTCGQHDVFIFKGSRCVTRSD